MGAVLQALSTLDSGYDRIHDPADLRVAIRELGRAQYWLTQVGDFTAEMADIPVERAVGVRAAAAVLTQLRHRAQVRLTQLSSETCPEVVVVEPEKSTLIESSLGLSVLPMVTVPTVATQGLSSAVVKIHPGHASMPTAFTQDLIVVVLFGSIQVMWWAADNTTQMVEQRRHQHALVRRGTRHTLLNPGAVPAVALHIQAMADVLAGFGPASETARGQAEDVTLTVCASADVSCGSAVPPP